MDSSAWRCRGIGLGKGELCRHKKRSTHDEEAPKPVRTEKSQKGIPHRLANKGGDG